MIWLTASLALADLVTTVAGVRIAGPGAESNLLFQRLIARHGLEVFVAGYAIVAGAAIGLASRFEGALEGLAAVLALIVANNGYAIWRLARAAG
ncbi:hypothetical protein [Chelatococcus reniformis]|uniref:DUF5658 domain-containing protein n=1 Tax=Chelatococcus reniformis TaxID=1494448 RepID=A0A916UX43_9HYPH|nr:hypothetical protein [Chelatococcus reniformis]GGC92661.1 hypothetical protein GCM10010994_58120 [Chelatococcus reniformis]